MTWDLVWMDTAHGLHVGSLDVSGRGRDGQWRCCDGSRGTDLRTQERRQQSQHLAKASFFASARDDPPLLKRLLHLTLRGETIRSPVESMQGSEVTCSCCAAMEFSSSSSLRCSLSRRFLSRLSSICFCDKLRRLSTAAATSAEGLSHLNTWMRIRSVGGRGSVGRRLT